MKYATEMGSDDVRVHTKFHKDWFRNSKVNRGDSQARREHEDRISLL
jgi:hypothetical protein